MDDISVREASADDAPEVLDAMARIVAETDFLMRSSGEFTVPLKEERDYLQRVRDDERSLFLVARCEGRVVGTLGFQGSSFVKYRHAGEFGMGVARESWGAGVGSRLLGELLAWCAGRGITKVNLKVMESNDRAIRLYEKFGFEVEGRIRNGVSIRGEYANLIMMGKMVA